MRSGKRRAGALAPTTLLLPPPNTHFSPSQSIISQNPAPPHLQPHPKHKQPLVCVWGGNYPTPTPYLITQWLGTEGW